MDTLALILVIIGALNWGMVGLFQFDLIASIFGGMSTVVSLPSLPSTWSPWACTAVSRLRWTL